MKLTKDHWLIRWYTWLHLNVYKNDKYYVEWRLGINKFSDKKMGLCQLIRVCFFWPAVFASIALLSIVLFGYFAIKETGAVAGVLGGVFIFLAFLFFAEKMATRFEKNRKNKKLKDKKPNVLFAYIKAVKTKVCPIVTIK